MKPIRVMIVDDHEVVRMGLRAALELEEDMEVVAEAGDAQAALREADVSGPDVVLMDVRMPGIDGIQACRALRESQPDTRGVMLTSFSDEEAVYSSIMAGAGGFLLKNTRRADLLTAVRAAAAGESLLDPGVAASVLARLRKLAANQEEREVALLSGREREVLALVAQGLTNKQIAANLFISENTVRNHVSRILEKLDLSRRSEAASWAATHGLLGDDQPKTP